MTFEKLRDSRQRLLASAQKLEVGLENMHHPLPHMHFAPSTLVPDEVSVPAGIIKKDLRQAPGQFAEQVAVIDQGNQTDGVF